MSTDKAIEPIDGVQFGFIDHLATGSRSFRPHWAEKLAYALQDFVLLINGNWTYHSINSGAVEQRQPGSPPKILTDAGNFETFHEQIVRME